MLFLILYLYLSSYQIFFYTHISNITSTETTQISEVDIKSQQILQDYKILERLGSGSFSTVYKAIHIPTKIKVAIKQIHKQNTPDFDQKVQREINIMSQFDHPNIIKLYQVIINDTDIFLVQELAEDGEMYSYIVNRKSIDIKLVRSYFQQTMAAVNYLHTQMQISHRDIKTENLLLSKNQIKVSDFGLSQTFLEGTFLNTACGSLNFAAPELTYQRNYIGSQCDMWSCGCVLYALLTSRLPFDDSYTPTLFRKIRTAEYELPPNIDPDAAQLIKGLITINPDQRYTMQQVYENKWFQKDLPSYLRTQFENGYDKMFGLVDEEAIVQEVNRILKLQLSLQDIRKILQQERITSDIAVTYRLLYDQAYTINLQQLEQRNVNAIFSNIHYQTFIQPSQSGHHSNSFYFGINLLSTSVAQPAEVMMLLLKICVDNGYKYKLGQIYCYKYFDENKKQEIITLKVEQKKGWSFCLRRQNYQNYLEYELIIGCQLYSAIDANQQQRYVLDVRKITGEITTFLHFTNELAEKITEGFKLKYNQ